MEKKIINLRECEEDTEIILPFAGSDKMDTCQVIDKDGVHICVSPKDPFDLVPKSEKEFLEKHPWCNVDHICNALCHDIEDVAAFIALMKLRLIWHEWRNVFVACKKRKGGYNVCYNRHSGKIVPVGHNDMFAGILDFKEQSHAEKFIECFGELLEKAKILL